MFSKRRIPPLYPRPRLFDVLPQDIKQAHPVSRATPDRRILRLNYMDILDL